MMLRGENTTEIKITFKHFTCSLHCLSAVKYKSACARKCASMFYLGWEVTTQKA